MLEYIHARIYSTHWRMTKYWVFGKLGWSLIFLSDEGGGREEQGKWSYWGITVHYTTIPYTTLHYTTLYDTKPHYSTLHCSIRASDHQMLEALGCPRLIGPGVNSYHTTLHYDILHYDILHYTTPNYTTLHYNALQCTTLQYPTLQYTTLPFNALHYTTLHYTTLHYTTLNYTTTLYYIILYCTTLQYITKRVFKTKSYELKNELHSVWNKQGNKPGFVSDEDPWFSSMFLIWTQFPHLEPAPSFR